METMDVAVDIDSTYVFSVHRVMPLCRLNLQIIVFNSIFGYCYCFPSRDNVHTKVNLIYTQNKFYQDDNFRLLKKLYKGSVIVPITSNKATQILPINETVITVQDIISSSKQVNHFKQICLVLMFQINCYEAIAKHIVKARVFIMTKVVLI